MSNDIGAILPVNLFGACCDHDELKSIAKKYNVPLIYDSAQAFGTKYKGKNVGSLGDAEIFSFHATKVLHTGEGGAVVTNNRDLYKKLCKIRNFGFNQYLNFAELGINGKMNEFSALVGLILLDKFDYYLSKREKIYDYYIKSISDIKGIIPLDTREIPHVTPNYSYFYVLIKPDIYGLTNLELYYVLIEENIISRCYFYPPVHRSEYYLKLSGSQNVKLPVTDKAALNTLALPFNSEMSFKEIDKIISAIKKCQLHSMEIKKAVSFKVPRTWQDLYKDDLEDPYDSVLTLKKS
jgi:dTDP-4-amino-4,6-dideoxygalactose transaminase